MRQFKARLEKVASDLQRDVAESTHVADAKLAVLGDQFAALSKKRDVRALSVRLAVLERALPKPPVTVKGWKIGTDSYEVTPQAMVGGWPASAAG